ncbi:efflux RND transporter periplasmic adaptor subunit [Moraxella sp. FZLJ2107]|uniref:efflux RND transporter periplasmic adaptor subunit n=1 Tax=unclassified Moraxella TaxID=2685852 RepID=UPI0020C8CF9C|nr:MULTISPECIES: efflux RND transporter periplasmic adaptor subunit [unclassified Moraxella]UTO05154.1 efflux RND transporter periplasmic adaptor subunit [Moraxella sp. FZLJ2107]UTO21889.1 efflux RND transporter periplasmic adaptor subunit [Moraxella sp. FZLJ2109]
MKVKFQVAMIVALMAGTGVLTACSKSDEQQAAAAQQQAPKATVDIQTIQLQPVPIIQTFAGRVAAVETSEVRPQVTGIVDEVLFREGAIVQAGQPLYRINVDSYTSAIESARAAIASAEASVNNAKASRASAQANLQSQEANLAQARADLSRYKELIEVEAVSRQVYDQAITAVRTAEANVAAARAAVQQAEAIIQSSQSAVRNAQASLSASELDVGRTIVRAPITGRIGISNVTAGALVSANQSQSMVTINRLDQVYVDISQSSAEMLKMREEIASGKMGQGSPEVQLVLEDGTTYPIIGRLLLANAKVDEKTGAVTLRALFPNPNGQLLPGMFVNARLIQTVVPNAALLPQSAITRTAKGETQVYVVNAQNKIEVRDVTTAGTYNGNWIVTGGINNGDRVVIIGGSKVKADQEVDVRELPPAGVSQEQAQGQTAPTSNSTEQGVPAQSATQAPAQPAVPMARPAEQVDGKTTKQAQ